MRADYVRPDEVYGLRARLAPAIFASGDRALRRAWERHTAAPCGWYEAPARLAEARAFEDELANRGLFGRQIFPDAAHRHTTGSIAGHATVAELADLVADQRFQLAALDKVKPCAAWAAADPAGYGAWAASLFDASAAMTRRLEQADTIITITPDAVASVTPAQDMWDAILEAAKPFHGIMQTLGKAGYCTLDLSGRPAPKASDPDLKAYNWSGDALDDVKSAADSVKSTTPWVALGIAAVGVLGLAVLVRR